MRKPYHYCRMSSLGSVYKVLAGGITNMITDPLLLYKYIACSTAVTEPEYKWIIEFKLTKDNPCLTLMGKLYGVYINDFGENLKCYSSTARLFTRQLTIFIKIGILLKYFSGPDGNYYKYFLFPIFIWICSSVFLYLVSYYCHKNALAIKWGKLLPNPGP